MNNFILRIFSSIFLLPITLYIIFLNNFFFQIFLLIVFAISIYELRFAIKSYLFLVVFFLLVFFIISFYKLRGSTLDDFYFLLWFLFIVWLSDIGGYVVGKFFKGPKLSKWSPNKTISGFFGSIIFSQFAFCAFLLSKVQFKYSISIIFIQFFFSIISILGDLFFSYLKRVFKIKDFSNIIPGHGGLLDRIDGLIFVIICAYIFKYLYE